MRRRGTHNCRLELIRMAMRDVVAIITIDDDRAIEEDVGTIEYLEREFGWLDGSGIHLVNARILDEDDSDDEKALEMVNSIFS